MKTIIAGGRDYALTEIDVLMLESLIYDLPITEVVHGGCRGIDTEAGTWAKKEGLEVKVYPADWDTHGRAAGPIRNEQMAQYADACILFKGGRGTANMKKNADKYGLNVIEL